MEKHESTDQVGRGQNPLRLFARWAVGLLAVFLISDFALGPTPYWFFQPWTGPLARQNVNLFCLFQQGRAGDVVILGDSRARHDFVGGAIEEELAPLGPIQATNLGLDAAQLIAMSEIADRLMKLEPPPRVVVLTLAAYSINDHNPRLARDLRLYARPATMAKQAWLCPDWDQRRGAVQGLAKGLEICYQLAGLVWAGGGRGCKARLSGAYEYPLNKMTLMRNQEAVPYRTEASRERAYREEVARFKDEMLREASFVRLGLERLREIVMATKRGGATPLLLLTPESAEFREATRVAGRDEAELAIAELCRELGVSFTDLNQPPYRPDSDDFFDRADHLSPGPAIELSRKVAKDLIGPALRRTPRR